MKILRIIYILIFSIFIFGGCAGKNFKWEDVYTVKIGDSSEQLIKKMGGKPYKITAKRVKEIPTEIYIWVYVGFDNSTKSVSFPLQNDKVIDIPFRSKGISEL